ncbi:Probable protein phosphatase 2C 28 [Striga hermonthica]|uniref:protein-serine/threonine phosphatase n=1 Tax=Striga hermonthica TaxID=68872 RepID=A0A9N7RCB6_STRHE|nr:Probable protein phosphatase 2C 28 [Striga hermonthica]
MRHGMEDYLVATCQKMNGHELGLYAIFDGHSGRQVAEYLKNNLFDNILNEPEFWTNPEEAIKRVFIATDNYILENVVCSAGRGGSTALAAILIDKTKLILANVGDSRAVLCSKGNVKQVTVDHEPMREKKLVESKGGFVSNKPGNVPRVDGQLAMTRAFGDEKVKQHITVEPDVTIEKIDEDTDYIILASDGLWKVLSSEEAVDCIQGLKDEQEAAEKLIKEALSRESKDDISCVVVMFH